MSRKRLVIANWKMYLESAEGAKEYVRTLKRKVRGLSGVEVAIAAPVPFITELAHSLESSSIRIGAQAISAQQGAHTGEVSAAMVCSAGADFVIIGHSERRALGETNEMVHQQLVQAASVGLMPVLCVGELERSDDGSHVAFIAEQLRTALTGAQSLAAKLVVAYEPVWAIGKSAGQAMGPADVRQMAIFIRKSLADVLDRKAALKIPVLYGGSVEPENAPALIVDGDVAGFLVGHASADVTSFMQIVAACKK